MQQPDMRIGARHHFAVHLQHQPQHAVRGRMLRAEIHRMAVDLDARGAGRGQIVVLPRRQMRADLRNCGFAHGFSPLCAWSVTLRASRFKCAFSSPGNEVIASHGDRKSKLRKSCVSFTGS